ncbi:unnamed protein product [Acanthosepion pharaonis]|uniref:Uncharacterized protein n=1 Tax=Acanthosepion pharaonis TaxID=158019 RepID=A0A812DFE0_ACAPH|nr:unnamed protein product [Sepia pharaonis]
MRRAAQRSILLNISSECRLSYPSLKSPPLFLTATLPCSFPICLVFLLGFVSLLGFNVFFLFPSPTSPFNSLTIFLFLIVLFLLSHNPLPAPLMQVWGEETCNRARTLFLNQLLSTFSCSPCSNNSEFHINKSVSPVIPSYGLVSRAGLKQERKRESRIEGKTRIICSLCSLNRLVFPHYDWLIALWQPTLTLKPV